MKIKVKFFFILLVQLIIIQNLFAHPGSGIVADKNGNIYFTDTGKGIWKIDTKGILSYIPSSRFHWLDIDSKGSFSESPKSFGGYFERVTAQGEKPALIMSSDFPLTINRDANIYYASTRPNLAKIMKLTPQGVESVFLSDKIFEFVSGITSDNNGNLFITESSNENANTIRKITSNGKMTVLATYTGKIGKDLPLETTPCYCRGLAVDSLSNIYVAATGSRCLLKISPAGKISVLYQGTSPWTPTAVTVFHGEVYFLEWHDVPQKDLENRTAWIPRVRKIDKTGKVTTLVTIQR